MSRAQRRRVVQWVATAIFVVCIGLSLAGVFLQVKVVPVMSGSMSPTFPTGSVVVTHKVDSSDVRVGDVIAFRPPSGFSLPDDRPVLHRVVSIELQSNGAFIITKGDANPAIDPWKIRLDDAVLQRASVGLPSVGRITAALTNTDPEIRSVATLGLVLLAGAVICWPRAECRCHDAMGLRVGRL